MINLPSDMRFGMRSILEAAGGRIIPVFNPIPRYVRVELPSGWRVIPTNDYKWTNLVDEKGRKRGEIYCMPTFNLPDTYIQACCRYTIVFVRADLNMSQSISQVKDCEQVLFTSQPFTFKLHDVESSLSAQHKAGSQSVNWLNEHFPNWRDPSAYWNEEIVPEITMQVICECESWRPCLQTIKLPLTEVQKIVTSGLVVIVDGCINGPNPSDQLVERREGYSLYREQISQ